MGAPAFSNRCFTTPPKAPRMCRFTKKGVKSLRPKPAATTPVCQVAGGSQSVSTERVKSDVARSRSACDKVVLAK